MVNLSSNPLPLSGRPSASAPSRALAQLGAQVRARLDADPSVYRLPVEGIEIYAVANFFTADECARLMAITDAVAKPSTVYYSPEFNDFRTSFSGDVNPADPFILMLQRRIDDLLGINPAFGETIQAQRYQPGQQFKGHFDYFVTTEAYWPDEQRRGGQRSWTAMGYLNNVEEGGSTNFEKVELSIPPQTGVLLIWNNMQPDGSPNPNSLHAGTPVVRGAKYVVTKWYRAQPWG